MAHVFKNNQLISDAWVFLQEEEALPETGSVILPFKRWQAARTELLMQVQENALMGQEVGLLLAPGDRVETLVEDLSFFTLIALEFPQFTDGRGYSTARILRDHMGYRGEIRAVGEILLDQIPFMHRCGIDSYVIEDPGVRAALARGENPEVVIYMQPASVPDERPLGKRPWLRWGHRASTLPLLDKDSTKA